MKQKYFYLGNGEKNALATINDDNNYAFDIDNYKYDESIKNDSRIAIAKEIKKNKTVLDVGCANGILGAILVKHKNATVDGIEYDAVAAKIAASNGSYRHVYNFSISNESSSKYKEFMSKNLKYDYIIFADVLEHLENPWEFLVASSKLLNKNGEIIISLPNIAHIDVIRALVNQEFNYSKWGLLDKTHLRFFTPSSFDDMLENIAITKNVYFNAMLINSIIYKPDYCDENYDVFKNDNCYALQHIYKLTLAHNNKRETNIKNKEKNTFDKFLAKYNTLLAKEQENNYLKEALDSKTKELDAILNSKRWQLINKILRIFGK